MVEVARIRIQLENLERGKGAKARESGAAKRQRLTDEQQAEETEDSGKKVKGGLTQQAAVAGQTVAITRILTKGARPGLATGVAASLGPALIGALARRGPTIAAGIAATELLDKFQPLIQEGIKQALGPELGRIVGVPVEELAVLIRKLKASFSAEISAIGELGSLVNNLQNAGVNAFENPEAIARAYAHGETIASADKNIEEAFEREESNRNLLNNATTFAILVQQIVQVLSTDQSFMQMQFDYWRKAFKK